MSERTCDGCGLSATDEHVARRLKRLELASRFRPIHISVLFLAETPPLALEDYFYHPKGIAMNRSGLSGVLFAELMQGCGIGIEGRASEDCLKDFQRRGFFLADSVECPVEDVVPGVRDGTARASAFELAHRYGSTVAKRIQFSYKPKHVVLLSTRTRHVLPFLEQAGLRDRILLYQGLPLHFPHPHNPAAQGQFRAGLAEILERARKVA